MSDDPNDDDHGGVDEDYATDYDPPEIQKQQTYNNSFYPYLVILIPAMLIIIFPVLVLVVVGVLLFVGVINEKHKKASHKRY